jgi:hypothetical protein
MDRLVVQHSGLLDRQHLASVRAIYHEAFAGHLRVPFEELAQPGPRDAFLVALDRGHPVGFAALRLLDSAGWVFLRYFAISAHRRREHLGHRFWSTMRQSVIDDGWPDRIAFEVEHPGEAGDEAERLVREGRISFWAGCGAGLLPVPGYVMPDITGLRSPEPMLLMAAAPAAVLDGDELSKLVLAVYVGRYGLSPADLIVRRALNSISATHRS